MAILTTDRAANLQTFAFNTLLGFGHQESDFDKFDKLHQGLQMTLLALEQLILSVREDEIQQQAEQVLPVRPVPTGGRRGRPLP